MRRIRRLGIYPVPIALLQLSYSVALVWVLGRKWLWKCPSCGEELVRHSIFSRIYRILFWIGLAALCFVTAYGLLFLFLG
jgi:hypothetical protein